VIVATLPAAGTFFSVYESAKSFFGRHGSTMGVPQPVVHSAASAVAEMASCVILTPAEVIKQNAQMLSRSSGGSSGSGSGLSSSTSIRALRQLGGSGAGWRLLSGYAAMVARNLPFTAIQFPIFEHVRKTVWGRRSGTRKDGTEYGTREKRSLLETGIITGTSAGLAGSFAAVVTTPMDVVKTRIMLMAGEGQDTKQNAHNRNEKASAGSGSNGQNGLSVARQVLREKGVPGLFRGAALRAVWTAIGSGLYLGMYEVSKVWLTRGKGGEDENFS
jgi:solute carrier family 25 S-adenosylmethionine transporter 26